MRSSGIRFYCISLLRRICFIFLFICAFFTCFCKQFQHGQLLNKPDNLILKNPDSALFSIQELSKKYALTGDNHALAICYQQMGKILYAQGAYPQALNFYYKADKLFRKLNDRLFLAQNLNNIGQTYNSVRLKEPPLPVFDEALHIFKELNNTSGIAQTYHLVGQFYEKRHAYDTALLYQQRALNTYQKIADSNGIAAVYANMGAAYEHKRLYDKAFHYLNSALILNKMTGNISVEVGILNNIGDTYRKTGKLKEALATTMQAKQMAVRSKNKRQQFSTSDDLAETYKLMGNTDSAYFYSQAANELYHQVFQEESGRQINLLHTLYEVERKDSEINSLKLDKQLTLITTGAIVVILLLLIMLGYTINSRQRLIARNDKTIFETQRNYMEVELKNRQLQEEKLNEELNVKSKELTSHTLHIIQKNQLLEELKRNLTAIIRNDKRDQRKELKQVVTLINVNHNQDKNWNDFRVVFENVHNSFFTNLKKHAENLTPADLRLLALLKMNLDSADIATMIGISQDSLRTSKYRLRQKLQIPEGEQLHSFIQQF